MKIFFLSLAVLVALAVLAGLFFYLVGRAQPLRHTATITFTVANPRATVWAALTDYAAIPAWWPAVKSIRMETRANGEIITWNTDGHGKEIGFRTKEERAPALLVREIVGADLPFGGTWTYALADDGGTTRVTLTEDGFITPPLFRGIAKFFLKPDATMRDFEQHFSAHLATK